MLTLPYHFPMKAEYTTLSTKGQIIIPAEIREQMKLAVGTKLSIQRDGQTLILRPITPEFIDSLCGSTKGLGKLRDAMHRDDEERRPMTTYVLDASAVLRFSDKEAGFDRVRDLFIQAAQGKVELLLSAVNWGEIVGALHKRAVGLSALTNNLAANLAALPLTIVAADKDLAEGAAIFKYNFKIPFVDAFAGSLALRETATLVTADYDFKSVTPVTIKIEFLPTK